MTGYDIKKGNKINLPKFLTVSLMKTLPMGTAWGYPCIGQEITAHSV